MYVAIVRMLEKDTGQFIVCVNGQTVAEMQFHIKGNCIKASVITTLVNHQATGMEDAIFNALIQYARENYLVVFPEDQFIQQKLWENSDAYEDVWYEL